MLYTLKSKFDYWIFNTYTFSDESLSLYRIFYCLFTIFFVTKIDFLWISAMPKETFFPPISFLSFFSIFPPALFFYLLNFLIYTLLFCLLIGYKTQISGILVSIFIFIGSNYASSFGKIDHDFIIILIPFIMSFTNWGNQYAIEPAQKTYLIGWQPALLSLLFGFSMFTASIPKILTGWLSFETQNVYLYIQEYYYIYEWKALLAKFVLSFNNKLFWELVDYYIVFFEFIFIGVFFSKKWFKLGLISCVFFHIGVMLLMDINFVNNIVFYTLFFLPIKNSIFHEKLKSLFENKKLILLSALILISSYSIWGSFTDIIYTHFSNIKNNSIELIVFLVCLGIFVKNRSIDKN